MSDEIACGFCRQGAIQVWRMSTPFCLWCEFFCPACGTRTGIQSCYAVGLAEWVRVVRWRKYSQ